MNHKDGPETAGLPHDFLRRPASDITVSRVDFANSPIPRYAGLYAVVLDNVLSAEECETLVAGAESMATGGWERAMINIGDGEQTLDVETRHCGRIMWDSQDLADRVWKRIEHLPEVQEITRLENVPDIFGNAPQLRREVWRFSRPNERLRFLKYVGGEYFRPHYDGMYETPDNKERSYFTLHLYLNSGTVSENEFAQMSLGERAKVSKSEHMVVGGATTFHSFDLEHKIDILPKVGRILLFQQRNLLHSGDDVVSGVKFTMRTDLMYEWESSKSGATKPLPLW